MTLEVVDAYGHGRYPYALGSLSSSRPASTESKATTNSACFFEVPHANQNNDLMVSSTFFLHPLSLSLSDVAHVARLV